MCIIGSGAGGGTAAKILTEGGLSVVMLEAGPRVQPDKDFKEHLHNVIQGTFSTVAGGLVLRYVFKGRG